MSSSQQQQQAPPEVLALQRRMEAAVKELQEVQGEFGKAVESRTKLESQLQENEMVMTEFGNLNDDARVYKLVGPVLVKQDRTDATTNVRDRIQLIKGEITRAEATIKDLEKRQDTKRAAIAKIQQEFQAMRSGAISNNGNVSSPVTSAV